MDSVKVTDCAPVPFLTKLNPLWWLVGADGWAVPDINNGKPYLPDVTNRALRIFYWFFCRNPLMNFVGANGRSVPSPQCGATTGVPRLLPSFAVRFALVQIGPSHP
jgi:hypothetical protein